MSDTATPAPPRKKRLFRTIALAFVLLLILGGGAAGGYWWWTRAAPAAEAAAHEPAGSAMVPLQPFVVNLADREAPRFLRVTLCLVIDEEADAARIEKDPIVLARARSAILELLATQSAGTVTTPEGKDELKRAVAERSALVLKVDVRDVLFTDFVVQF
jgi:flagellar FliL protein